MTGELDIFVLGLDPGNLDTLKEVCELGECRFHSLLSTEELVEAEQIPVQQLLEKAAEEISGSGYRPDAIVGYWDFPVSSMVPLLSERFDLRGPDLRAMLICEHKYWSRVEQHKVISEHPNFGLVELGDQHPPDGVRYPLWVKPVKGFSSELAYRVDDDEDFRAALESIRGGIERAGEPFQYVLDQVDLPAEIADIGAQVCLAEEAVSGQQVTMEGYRFNGEVHVYGTVDSHMYEGTSSFQRYQYPSALPAAVLERMAGISREVINHIGLNHIPFNIEYFWESTSDTIRLLEINPRHSQSHATLFDYVDGLPNHRAMVQLALGHAPEMPYRKGKHAVAANFFVRRFSDGTVRTAPSAEDVARAEEEVGGCSIDILVNKGDRLSDLPDQDSYSYATASIHIGANDEEELHAKYEHCLRLLPFEFDG